MTGKTNISRKQGKLSQALRGAENPTSILRSPTEESWAVWEYKSPLTQLWKTEKMGKLKCPNYTSSAKTIGKQHLRRKTMEFL